jgi:dihydropyrimidinase
VKLGHPLDGPAGGSEKGNAAMFDLIVTGGLVVMPGATEPADIGVAGDKIVATGAPGSLASTGALRTVDASGQIVIPGGVDPHIHCNSPIPFPGRNEDLLSAPPDQVSRAALYGGTTTLLDFAPCPSDQPLQQSIEMRKREWAGACHCDYGFHLLLHGKLSQGVLDPLAEAVQDGHASVKMFTTDIRPNRQGRMVRFGDIWEVLKILGAAGGLAAIHAEDNDIVMHMYEKLIREDRTGFENMAEVHNTLSEDLSFNRVIRLAENVEGAALYMVHVSAAAGVAAIAASRGRGFPIYGETLHQYLLYNAEDYKRPGGQMFHTYPSLKFPKDQEALWAATDHGAIQAIATDEVCCPLQVKLQGRRIDDTTGGNSGVEPRVSLMYTHLVEKRGYSLGDFVGLTSANAARIMGLYPRKGALAVGSDADIVLLDPRARRVLRKEDLHETDYTPWAGHEVAVWPSMTILRGKIVVENGAFLGAASDGQFLPRKIGDDIRSRPAV